MPQLYWSKSLKRKVLPRNSSPHRPKKPRLKEMSLSQEDFRATFNDERLRIQGFYHRSRTGKLAGTPEQEQLGQALERWKTQEPSTPTDEAFALFCYAQFWVGKMVHDKVVPSWVQARGLDFALEALFEGLWLIRRFPGHEPEERMHRQIQKLRGITAFVDSPLALPARLEEAIWDDPVLAVVAAFLDPENAARAERAWSVIDNAPNRISNNTKAMLIATASPIKRVQDFIRADSYVQASRAYLASAVDVHGEAICGAMCERMRAEGLFWNKKDPLGEALTAFGHDPEVVGLLVEAIDLQRVNKPRKEVEAFLVEHPQLSRELLEAAAPGVRGRAQAVLDEITAAEGS